MTNKSNQGNNIDNDDDVINNTYEAVPYIHGSQINDDALSEDLDSHLKKILAELADDESEIKIHVRRIIPNTGNSEICFTALATELPIVHRIKSDYGPGEYKITINGPGGRFIKRFVTRIAEKIKIDNKNDSTAFFKMSMDRQERQAEKYERLLLTLIAKDNNNSSPAPAAPLIDPVTMMASMMGVMMQMKEFMAPKENANSLGDLLENVKSIQEITGSGLNSGGETNFLDLAASSIPALVELAKKSGDKQQSIPQPQPKIQPQPQPQHQPQPQPQPAMQAQPEIQPKVQPQAPLQEMSEEEKMNLLKMQINLLISKAAQGSDPGLYAELVVDSIPENQLKSFLTMDDVLGYLIKIHPGVEQYKAWFEALIVEINELLNDEGIEEEIEFETATETEKDPEIIPATATEKERTNIEDKKDK